ncbi:MAG: hypothetical protein ACI8ZB_005518 [Desulforhopalus sp.]|jgi:hypothetical protein
MGYSRRDQQIQTGRVMLGARFKIVLIFCVLLSHSYLYAETLIPLKIQKGTNLITITRQFCTSEYHWKEIAKINNLKAPYIISAGDVLYAPIELLKAEKLSAKVASVIGGVFIVSNGKKLKQVMKGDFIYPGQTLVTEDDGFTHLVFPDNKYTRISSGSKFTLTYLVRLTDNSLKAEFFLEKGRITHEVKKQLEVNETFTTRTPVSVTGVRGTEFRLKVTDEKVNIVETLKGVVSVKGESGGLFLKKGEGTKVAKGLSPIPARPLPAIPVTPAVSDIVKMLPVKIDAPVDPAVSQYRLRITADENGNNTILEKLAKPGSVFTLLALPDGIYFGFLTAIDSESYESLPASRFTFEVRTIPGAPIFVSSLNGKATFETTIEKKWLQAEGDSSYHLQLAKESDFNAPMVDFIQKDTSYVTDNLEPGTYYVRVQAIASDEFRSLYSLVDSWKVQKKAELGTLEGSSKDGMNLRWATMGEGIVYDLQVGKNKDFTELLVSEEGLAKSEFTYGKYMEPATYYVRVRGVLDDGQVSPWTPAQKLKIDTPPFGFLDAGVLVFFLGIILL